jgi:cephalosporin-C deacetylase-like acetyl esterase
VATPSHYLGLMLALVPSAALPASIPAEAFGTLPQVSKLALSPDGNLLAWQEESGAQPQVVIFDVGARQNKRTVRLDADAKLRGLAWADGSTLLMTVSFTLQGARGPAEAYRHEFFRTVAVDVNDGQKHELLMEGGSRPLVTGAELISWHASRPGTVIMSTSDYSARFSRDTRIGAKPEESGWTRNLYSVDTRSGKGTLTEGGTHFVNQWVVDGNGAAVARSEWRQEGEIFGLYRKDGSAWREILHRERQGYMWAYGISADGKTVVTVGPGDDGRVRLWSVPLDGSAPQDMFPDATDDVDFVLVDQFAGMPVGVRLGGVREQPRWLDADAERRYHTVAKAFPGREIFVYGRSQSNTRVLAQVQGPSSPPVYYLVDFTTHRADIVGEAYPALTDVALGEVRVMTYKARDGTAIAAYLTLPPGAKDKTLPLIVLPHGGPAARDHLLFDWWAQFLAVRGYAVLQPQFRGSSGFGAAFERAGYKQWGGLMQDDVTDGVQALIAQGVADPRRICIVGASYGGYAALAGAAFTPELYACAASINGVSNLPEMLSYLKDHSGADSGAVTAWRDHIGSSFDRQVIEKSPVHAADRVRAPVLLLHSTQDTVVPPSQSEQMANALKKAGTRVTLVKLEGDDHWLSRSSTRVQMLRELDTFLSANLH